MITTVGPLAIVGIGCRFPGASSPAAFWRLLCEGVDAIGDMPADRFDLQRLFDRDPARPGRLYTRWGGFIDGIDRFDAAFFGMSPREARHIDPQQRLLLELTWEAMEDAGIRADRLAATRTGVFIGISTHDYGDIQTYPQNRHLIGSHTNTGTATSLAANRISYAFDFRGPSMIVDTACSSSLSAVHLAAQSLGHGECDVAVVGGVQMLLTPEPTIGFCKATMLSPDGRCRAFAAGANGYVRSEGGGVVIVRPLAAAIADGDAIYAVIGATAINQDGHTVGMTVPSGRAQADLLRTALAAAGLTPADVHYVEAHGTGTPVGDPIEAGAIGAVMSDGLPPGRTCAIGSVKTNIGHLEAASGMAGLIKTALALQHRQIPPSLHFDAPNPAIDFAGLRLRVVTSLEPWPDSLGTATAGVNSFGFGGANAHIVLRAHEATAPARRAATADCAVPEALVLSAKSEPALAALAGEYLDLLAGNAPLYDICATAALRRTPLAHRVSVVGTRAEVLDGLDAFVNSERRAAVTSARAPSTATPPLAFVFSGMGPQWWAMGRQLLRDEPIFRSTVERCDAAMPREAGWSLLDELQADESASRVSDADLAQVTGFAVQAGLAELLRTRGIVPSAVFGHSAGEMAAAFVSGALTLEACVPLAYHRSRLQASAPPGRMLATAISEDAALRLVDASGGRLSLAAVNSPTSVTLSGDADAIVALFERLQIEQVFARLLPFPVAYHSSTMDGIEDELLASLASLAPGEATIPMVSAVTGDWLNGRDLGATYWWHNVRQPVRFAAGIDCLIAGGYRMFLDIGPHPVLSASIAECLTAVGEMGTVLPTLRRNENERGAMLRATGALHAHGYPVDWAAVFGTDWTAVALPLYPWDRQRHWFEPAPDIASDGAFDTDTGDTHPLLGRRLETANATWESPRARASARYLDDHIVQGAVVFPGVGYLEMAAAAVHELRPGADVTLRDVSFLSPLFGGTARVQLSMDRDGSFEVQSSAANDSGWTLHARGRTTASAGAAPVTIDLDAIRARCDTPVGHDECYVQLEARGLAYGPAFRGIQSLATGAGEALGRIGVTVPVTALDGHTVHPVIFDAALQVLIGAAASAQPDEGAQLFLPVGIHEVTYRQPVTGDVWSYARVTSRNARHVTGDVQIVADDGTILVAVEGLRCQIVDRAAASTESIDDWLYEDRWQAMPVPGTAISALRSVQLDTNTLCHAADTLSEASGWPLYYTAVEPALDQLAYAYAARAFEALGWTLAPGERITADGIASRILPTRRPFAARLLSLLHASGVLLREGDTFVVSHRPASLDTDSLSRACRTAWPEYGVHLDLLDRCGRSLADNLRGTRTAQEVLFAGDGFALLETFYREAPASAFYNTLAAQVVSTLVRDLPLDRSFRMLEVGAGTGGTTAAVLPMLERSPASYLFTDVSRPFLDAAAARFGLYPFVSTALFDLEADAQPAGRFDIILAANVVHATTDVARSLARLKALLEPGGLLVLLEITRQPAWLDAVFGLTDGWWQFTDRATRPDHALLAGGQWQQLLRAVGFDDVASVTDSNHPGEAAQQVMIARAPEMAVTNSADGDRWLLLADSHGVARELANRLVPAGIDCVLVTSGETFARTGAREFVCDPTKSGDLMAALAALDDEGLAVRGLIHLQSLDIVEAGSPDALLASQQIGCGAALAAVRGLSGASRHLELWLVTAGAQESPSGDAGIALGQSSLWGLGRVIMREHPELKCRLIDIGELAAGADVEGLAREMRGQDYEEEVAFRDGTRFVRRLQRLEGRGPEPVTDTRAPLPGEHWGMHIAAPGALQTLQIRPRARSTPGVDQVEVGIAAASINFRDVMVAMGTIPGLEQETSFGSRQLGLDAAGTILSCGSNASRFAPGDAVMGIVPGAFGSSGVTSEALLTRKPACLDFAQAASVPCVFVTAHYALNVLARLQAGERILIHSATGGVGLAAIQFARDAGAEIFATAGSPEKAAYLHELGIRHVMDSRSVEFADEILRLTNGEGVDVVLNSLAGAALAAGLRVLRPFGRFLEIGKRDIYEDGRIGLLPFRKNLSLHAIDLDRLCVERPAFVGTMLREVADRFDSGRLQPLPQRVWPISQTESAMRFMAQARHIGKIVLTLDDPDVAVAGTPAAGPRFKTDASYLVTGGLGGFGMAVAERLLRDGAGSLALIGRRPPSAETAARIEMLRAAGARIEVLQADVASADDVARLLQTVRDTMPPLRGIVHAAMVLDDGRLDQMEWPQFERVLAPKIAGAWNLHTQTARDDLDLFVMFSSIAALLGNPLQANYAAANAYLDALAHHRRANGLPGLSIAWGVLSGVGYVSGRPELSDYLARQGYLAFSPEQALDVLEDALDRQRTTVMAARLDWSRWAVASPTAATSPRFRHFAGSAATTGGARQTTRGTLDLSDPATRQARLHEYLREKIARVLGASAASIEPDRPLTELGLDSLMAVELTTALRIDLGFELPVVRLLQGITLNGLAAFGMEQLSGAVTLEHVAAPMAPDAAAAVGVADTAEDVEDRGSQLAVRGSQVTDRGSQVLDFGSQLADPSDPATRTVPATPSPTAAVVAVRAAPSRNGNDSAAVNGAAPERWSPTQRFFKSGLNVVLRLSTELRIEGIDRLPARGGAILAVNHLSALDVPLALAILPRPVIMLAKDDLRRSRILNWLLADIGGAIYVRRGEADSEALEQALAVLRGGGIVALGPEGRRSPGGLTQGHTGVGYLAMRAGVPVVPMAAWGQERLGQSWQRLRRAPVRVRFGPPLTFAGGATNGAGIRECSEAVMRAIAAQLPDEYRGFYREPAAAGVSER